MSALVKSASYSFQPTTFDELKQFCTIVADSELVPKDYRGKPGNVLVAIQMGADIGLAPMQAIQNIAVINGRPSLWGDAMLAVCMPHCTVDETFDDKTMTATCVITRNGNVYTRTFSKADAVLAGLWDKAGPWKQYPKRMLQMRARGFGLRDTCADVLRGLQSAEEQQDIPAPIVIPPARTKPADPAPPPSAAEKPLVFVWETHPLNGTPVVDAPPVVLTAYLQELARSVDDPANARFRDRVIAHRERVEAVLEAKLQAQLSELGTPPMKLADQRLGVDRDNDPDSWGLHEPPDDVVLPDE